jgi:beta-glucanase (GH16 family)
MLPTDWVYGDWPRSGDIDLMEARGDEPARVFMSLHYGLGETKTKIQDLQSGTFTEEFHVFALEWEADQIRWYIDDRLVHSTTTWHTVRSSGRRVDKPAPFNQRFHLLLNLAVGGTFSGVPDDTTVFPQTMEVDYVRVFSRRR